LSCTCGETLSSSAKSPASVPGQFVECGGVRWLQLLVRGSRFVQHATKFRRLLLRLRGLSLGVGNLVLKLDGLLEGSQQQALAGGQIVRKKVGVIHHAHRCSDFCKKRKSTLEILF
jgi:hypothetical protein